MNSQRYWYYAKVKNRDGLHLVFYACSRPKIGSSCQGVAGPNKVIGYKREKVEHFRTQKDVKAWLRGKEKEREKAKEKACKRKVG